ncbi:hypothetical protein [Flavihumibacter solisilvae]|uniref:Uncharacterized protein n=1 Tax=Flavihumibacter solisilvae TaxID=1349421 RepID=A0A0C1L7V4_9BACT|nr:hypothetical protein [Flavihumibacter solisilvae]KIC96227.1 hypothetical protein OI18_00180 [Flavihumibacter solisilvae]
MTNDQIASAIGTPTSKSDVFEIRFKARNPIKGMFIETSDYRELSRKNLWRIVHENNLEEYTRSQNEALARIFNGNEFTKLRRLS